MIELNDLSSALEPWREEVISVFLTLLSTFLLWLFRAKVKLTWGSTSVNAHVFKYGETESKVSVWTEKFYVHNIGKKAAYNIELVFSSVMTSYIVWPPRELQSSLQENGSYIIKVPSLAASELLVVDVIDVTGASPKLLTVNCPDAIASEVKFRPQRQFARSVNWLVSYLMLAGLFASIYAAVNLFLEF